MVEPRVNSCRDLPVLQQECRQTHLNADHLSFEENGRLFFLRLTHYVGRRTPEHRHSTSLRYLSQGTALSGCLGLSPVDLGVVTAVISLPRDQKVLLEAATGGKWPEMAWA